MKNAIQSDVDVLYERGFWLSMTNTVHISNKPMVLTEDSEEEVEDMEDMDANDGIDYCDRYSKVSTRCAAMKAENERLIHCIYKMKKLTKKYKKQKKLLMKRLSEHRVDVFVYDLPLFLEKDDSIHQTSDDVKPKNLMTKSNSNASNISSKAKKSKVNTNNRIESTSGGGTVGVVPKKPINPYLMFCQENRSSLQEKYHMKYNNEMTHQELTKALAQQWHELTVTAKQVYYNLFNNDKVRYENEMKIFAANSTKETTNESND